MPDMVIRHRLVNVSYVPGRCRNNGTCFCFMFDSSILSSMPSRTPCILLSEEPTRDPIPARVILSVSALDTLAFQTELLAGWDSLEQIFGLAFSGSEMVTCDSVEVRCTQCEGIGNAETQCGGETYVCSEPSMPTSKMGSCRRAITAKATVISSRASRWHHYRRTNGSLIGGIDNSSFSGS